MMNWRMPRRVACFVILAVTFSALCLAAQEAPRLELTAKSAVLMDYASGEVLFTKDAHKPLPPASVTKIMTLALALEALQDGRVQLDTMVTTSQHAARMGGTQIWLEPNEQMSYKDLLYAIAVGSANDAAVAVAEHLAGSSSAFVDVMNAKARSLGMKNTSFSNPNGLPPSEYGVPEPHVSSAYDLALLSRWAWKLPLFKDLASTWGPVVMRENTSCQPELWTFNKMMKQYPGMDGIKTGMTNEAGFCLAATAERNNVRLIAVALGAPTSVERNNDIAKLFDYGFSQLHAVKLAAAGEKIGEITIQNGKENKVAVAPVQDVVVSSRRDQKLEPKTQIIPGATKAPIKKGQSVGQLVVFLGEKEVLRVNLVALSNVEKASHLQMMLRTMQKAVKGK